MRKYLYLIKKQKIKSWLKFWLLTNNKFNIILSNILEGTSFNLQNTVKRYFKIFNIFGNSVQDGTPSPENPVPIHSVADDGTFTIDLEGQTENYNYTFITKPLRSLPNGVRDSLEDDGIHRRVGSIVLDGTANWSFASEGDNTNGKTFYSNSKSDMKSLTYQEAISLDDIFVISDTFKGYAFKELNETPRKLNFISLGINTLLINISNETGVKTVEEFKTYLNNNLIVVQYQLNKEVIEPYTEEQQKQYNKIKELYTFNGTTNIYSDDEVPPYLQIQYYMKGE